MKGTVFVILAMFLSVLPAFAQDWQTKATVSIPFEFSVNHKVFPAGDYEILTPGQKLLLLKNVKTGDIVWSSTVDAIYQEPASKSKLMFRQDSGSVAVLHQVIFENDKHANDLIHDKGVPELASR